MISSSTTKLCKGKNVVNIESALPENFSVVKHGYVISHHAPVSGAPPTRVRGGIWHIRASLPRSSLIFPFTELCRATADPEESRKIVLEFSYDAEVALECEDRSHSQEISSSDYNEMNVDSESTYSCLNTSSDGDAVGDESAHECSFENGSIDHNGSRNCVDHEDMIPKICTSDSNGFEVEGMVKDHTLGMLADNQIDMDADDKHEMQTPEAPCSASSESIQGINDETGAYMVPKLGVEFDSEGHAYKCYNKYALMEGFSIRKDFINKSKVTGFVVSRRYTCHRQGYGSSKHDTNMNKPRKETRTGCLAHMTVTRQPNGKYRVIHFETRHNHVLVTPLTAHLLPSQKRISFVEAIEAESSSDLVPRGVPKIGMGFDSEDHAYDFYNSYAGGIGFSVRKDYVNRSKIDGEVASRRYTCFREGHRQKDKRGFQVKRPRKETRVGCMAQLVISRQADGRYRVTHFEEHHNHELVPACKIRMLRSQKRTVLCSIPGGPVMPPKSLSDLLFTGAGTPEFPNYDHSNHEMILTTRRAWSVKQEETETMHQYFHRKKLKDPSFFYAVQLDAEEQLTNFFCADEKMLVDYGDFGDVVCFDTTHCLNRDARPLALFFGINNHKQILVFGAAFMYDDTLQSYKWLFQNFIRSMSGRKPKTILSDHDPSVSGAIISELPEANHRLCTWQVYQNTLRHLGELVAKSDSLSSDLCGCIFNTDEEDFVNSWKDLLDKYGLWESGWLHGKFELREKWALPYGKHIFSADIETALQADYPIASLRKYLKPESHVLHFIKNFGKMVNDWRFKELESNYDMGHHMPRIMGDVITLMQVRDVYTPTIFDIFHQEYENSLNLVINLCAETASSVDYRVCTYDRIREYAVLYTSEDDSVVCSCMKFQSVGILCSHALKVLDYRNVKIVPSQFVLKRWTRDARA